MTALDEKIGKFCADYALSPQQVRIFQALIGGALSNEALTRELGMSEWAVSTHLQRIAIKTMTVSRTELLYLFYEGCRGR